MPAEHRILLLTHDGEPLQVVEEFQNLEYTRTLNEIGWFTMTVPAEFPRALLQPDMLFEIYRKPEGGIEQLMLVGFLRKWKYFETSRGLDRLRLAGPDQMDLLVRAIIGYAAGEPQSDKTDFVDDMIKEIINENKGAGAGLSAEGRFRGYPADQFEIAGDESAAPSITRRFAWRDMWPVIQELMESSRHAGTNLYIDLVPTGHGKFQVRTYINLRGVDRTVTTGLNPILFSKEAGNLQAPSLEEDWTDEWNYIFGGGQGEGTARLIDTENDLDRILQSNWNRREKFSDAREEDTALGVAQKANQKMQDKRPLLKFEGELVDTPQTIFGVHWNFGDKVSARYRGLTIDGIVNNYKIRLSDDGEDVSAKLEVDLVTG